MELDFKTSIEAETQVPGLQYGETICYHIGNLSRDRTKDRELDRLANIMSKFGLPKGFRYCSENSSINGLNLGHLVQRRLSESRFAYLFQKR